MNNKIDPDIAKIYILVLKHGMKIRDIPSAWAGVDRANRTIDPDYNIEMPGYVKLILKYSTEMKGLTNGKTRPTKGVKKQSKKDHNTGGTRNQVNQVSDRGKKRQGSHENQGQQTKDFSWTMD